MGHACQMSPQPDAFEGRHGRTEDQGTRVVALRTPEPLFEHPGLPLVGEQESSIEGCHTGVVMSADLASDPTVNVTVVKVGSVVPLAAPDKRQRPIPSFTV